MPLKKRIIDVLRDGSINTPGKNAIEVLAGRLGVSLSSVRQILGSHCNQELFDLGNGNASYTSYLGLKNRTPFIPATPEARRQSTFAVDGQGRHYSSIIPPTHPNYRQPTTRHLTEAEWAKAFPDQPYPFADTDPSPQEVPTMTTDQPASEETGFPAEGNQAEAETSALQSEAEGQRAKASTKIPKQVTLTMLQQSTKPHAQQRYARVTEIQALLVTEFEQAGNKPILASDFKNRMAEHFALGIGTIGNDLTVLSNSGVLDFVTLEWQGPSFIILRKELSFREKLDLALETIRKYKRKPHGKLAAAIAQALHVSEASASSYYLTCLRHVGAYRIERGAGFGAWEVVYVMRGKLSDEQFQAAKNRRSEMFSSFMKGKGKTDAPPTEAEFEAVLSESASDDPQAVESPVSNGEVEQPIEHEERVASVQRHPSTVGVSNVELQEMMRKLLERSKADKARISELETELEEIYAQRARQDVLLASQAERLEHLTLMLEIERARESMVPTVAFADLSLVDEVQQFLES